MSKGVSFNPSNYRRVGSRNGAGLNLGSSSAIHPHGQYSHIDRMDVKNILIPILKEVGKAVCPPAAIPIEVLYQLYKHGDAIGQVGSAVMRGDYREAAKVIIKEGMKEVAGQSVGAMLEPGISKTSESIGNTVSNNLAGNEQEKQVAGQIAKGGIKGLGEAAGDKMGDKIVDKAEKVIRDERR